MFKHPDQQDQNHEYFRNKKESNKKNAYIEMVLNNGIADKIEGLQAHKNDKIYDLAVKLIENYFDTEEDF